MKSECLHQNFNRTLAQQFKEREKVVKNCENQAQTWSSPMEDAESSAMAERSCSVFISVNLNNLNIIENRENIVNMVTECSWRGINLSAREQT